MIFNLYLYMVVITSFFSLKFSNGPYWWLGPLIIIGWTLFYVKFYGHIEPMRNLALKRFEQGKKDVSESKNEDQLSV